MPRPCKVKLNYSYWITLLWWFCFTSKYFRKRRTVKCRPTWTSNCYYEYCAMSKCIMPTTKMTAIKVLDLDNFLKLTLLCLSSRGKGLGDTMCFCPCVCLHSTSLCDHTTYQIVVYILQNYMEQSMGTLLQNNKTLPFFWFNVFSLQFWMDVKNDLEYFKWWRVLLLS